MLINTHMKLYEISHGHDWKKAFHITNIDLKTNTHLFASGSRKGMNKNDAPMIAALPEYSKSIFFSMGWPRAAEWDEFKGDGQILQYSTEYLLDNFPCTLLKSDHKDYRFKYLEYFIDDPQERAEYLTFIQPFRVKNSNPSYADHPLLKKWSQEAANGTIEEYKGLIKEQLAVFGKNDISQYLKTHEPYFEELLVQGKIPVSKATATNAA